MNRTAKGQPIWAPAHAGVLVQFAAKDSSLREERLSKGRPRRGGQANR